jgi:two-component sensor histidine kinase
VFATGKPVFSHFFTASIANTRIITIDVPVMRDGAVVYVISFNPPLSTFQHIIETQSPGPDWTISIFDQRGINFARVPNPEQMVGQRASLTLFSEMFKANEAKIETVSLEGVPLLTAYSHSPLSGWIVAAGVATRTLTAPLWRTLAMTVGIGAVLLATGMYFAISMAARISRAETLHELLVAELNHRAKNTLATVQSIAMQTFQPNVDLAEARRKFTDRVAALGRANTLLGEEKWVGADVRSIAESVLEPYSNDGRVQIKGPQLRLPAAEALTLSMILHELATNAAKYGALSNTAGRVRIEWEGNSERFTLIWREEAGPPVQRPQREGFGSYLITSGLAAYGGSAVTTYNEGGLVCVITCQSRKQG